MSRILEYVQAQPGAKLVLQSHKAKPKDVCVLLKRNNRIDPAYIQDAVDRQVGLLLVASEPPQGFRQGSIVWGRNEVEEELRGYLQAVYKPEDFPPILGVVGTKGKTTTSWFIAQVLEIFKYKVGVIGSCGWGSIDSLKPSGLTSPGLLGLYAILQEMKQQQRIVMEVSSHAIDQQRILGVPFDSWVFLNCGRDHLDYHKTLQNYQAVKKRPFLQMSNPAAKAIINLDDELGREIYESVPMSKRIGYSLEQPADYHIKVASLEATKMQLELSLKDGRNINLCTGFMSNYNLRNLLAALAFVDSCYGLKLDCLPASLAFHLPPGRWEEVQVPLGRVIIDFAHTPESLRNFLQEVKQTFADKRLIVVFGCGGGRDRGKRMEMAKAVEECADEIIVTSDNPRGEKPQAIIEDICKGFSSSAHFQAQTSRKQAIHQALSNLDESKLVLICGKGAENYIEQNGERIPFSDRETVEDFFHAQDTKEPILGNLYQ